MRTRPFTSIVRAFLPVLFLLAIPSPSRSQWGHVSVSQGVSVSPNPVVLESDFTVSFTLKETSGDWRTFEQIAVDIRRSDNSFLFTLATYSNVTINANATWSRSPSGQIYGNPAGTYKAVVRGKLAGGAWFDFDTTGSGVNPKSFPVVAPTGFVSVSAGVTVTPDPVYLEQSFTAAFSLKETDGWAITFAEIAVDVRRNDNTLLFNLATYSNVSFSANQTRSWSPSGQIYDNPAGTYKVVVRGRISGGAWFDFTTTGSGTNPRSFTVLQPTGFASVSSGVEISPAVIYASDTENFSARFTLTETTGWPITFAEVTVGITDAGGGNLFDLEHFTNVTVPAGGTWSYPWRGGYLNTPGTYRAYARGHVAGGAWFDFTVTGGGQNPAVFEVLPVPTGFASVSSGVEISPAVIYASDTENFSARFTLTETTGWPITFADVHVGITDASGNNLFDLEHFTNVTVSANGSWSYPWRGGYLGSPGTYRAYARGRVEGGDWFDFTVTGSGVNPCVFDVLPAPTGFASVSSGVDIYPETIYASPTENFSARFTLQETTGSPITFADVHVGVTDASGSNLFDLEHFTNVTVPASGSWSYPWRGGYLSNPGTYRAYARGRVEGGSWFDFTTTGAGANPAVFVVVESQSVDGFDYPIAPPNGAGYWLCQDFLEEVDIACNHLSWNGTHLGEDWNRGSSNDDCGDSVHAVADGVVARATDDGSCWGFVVIVRHEMDDGTQVESMYGHLGSIAVQLNDPVTRGQVIGVVGGDGLVCDGTPMTCHLHFEMRTQDCREWGDAGPGYSSDPTGWIDPSDFIDAHRFGTAGGSSGGPGPITDLLSTTHVVGEPSSEAIVATSWQPPDAPPTTVAGYSVAWTESASSSPDSSVDVVAPFHQSGALGDGDTWYFHARAVGTDGSPGPTDHLGPFIIDTSVGVSPTPTSPLAFDLGQSSPNPARDATQLVYSLTRASRVRLAIYDAAGRLVRVLGEGVHGVGRHAVQWDGRDSTGARVAAGVFFVRLTSEEGSRTTRVVILR